MGIIRDFLRKLYYPLKRSYDYFGYRAFIRESNIHVEDTMTTIRYILSNHVSVSRYGDGEYMVMAHKGNGFQKPDEKLCERLKEVLNSRLHNHIVCLPYAFVDVSHMTSDARNFWYPFCGTYKDLILKITDSQKKYYDTNFTRFYMDFRDKSKTGEIVELLKQIWNNRDIVIVEGEYSKLGVGNDLFDNAKNIQRIVAPSKNAFQIYDEILQIVSDTVLHEKLILVALGMTATVLCYDLAKLGYQAIDIGHIDIEYSWYLMRARNKCPVPGKAVNELGAMPEDICDDIKYNQSIIAKIV